MNKSYKRPESLALAVVASAEDITEVRRLADPYGVSAYTLNEFLEHRVVQTNAGGQMIAVEKSELLLGGVSTSQAGVAALDKAADQLALFSGPSAFSRCALGGSGGSFEAWLARQALELSGILARDSAQLRRALAALRREHDETLERYAELEAAVDLATPRRVLKLGYDPGYSTLHLEADAQVKVIQRIPASPSGTALIELHLEPRSGDHRGELNVNLYAGGSPEPAYAWSIPVGGFLGGWFPLWLDRALAVEGVELKLELGWTSAADDPLSLTLSTPTPLTEFFAQGGADAKLAAPLAMRIWRSPPGSPVSARSMRERRGAPGTPKRASSQVRSDPVRFALGNSDLMRVELAAPLNAGAGFDLVKFRAEQLDTLVHPVAGVATIGVVKGVAVSDVQQLSAIVAIDNKQSLPVEFGLAIVPSQANYEDPASLISRWTRVEALDYAEVLGTVDQSESLEWDLLLGARMADMGDPNLAWAYFKRVEVLA